MQAKVARIKILEEQIKKMEKDGKIYKADMLKHQSFIRFKQRNKKLKAVNDRLKQENDEISNELAKLKEKVDAVQ